MEIRIKTAEEFRDAHVVIEIRAEEDGGIRVRPLVDERLYDPNAAIEVMTGNYQRAQAALAERADRIAELQAQLSKAEAKAHAFNLDRKSEDERLYTASEVGALQASEAELVAKPLQAALAERADRIAELEEEIRRMDDQISAQTERADKLNERNAGLAGELARERDRNAELVEQLARVDKGHVCTTRCQSGRRQCPFQKIKELEEEIRRMDDQISIQTERSDEINERNAELVGELARQRNYAADNREWAERAESRLAEYAVNLNVAERKLKDAERAIEILSSQLGRISGAVHGRELIQAVSVARSWDRKEPRAMAEAIRQVRDILGSPSLPEAASEPTSQA